MAELTEGEDTTDCELGMSVTGGELTITVEPLLVLEGVEGEDVPLLLEGEVPAPT